MLRITGGEWGGQRIAVPPGDVRPTQDRVRQALGSMLADALPGSRFLDLFAGSGAVGLDAMSRGAAYACWVESSNRVLPVLRANVEKFCPKGCGKVIGGDVFRVLHRGCEGAPFGIIFADPPYRDVRGGGGRKAAARDAGEDTDRSAPDFIPRLLEALEAGLWLDEGAQVILEAGEGAGLQLPEGWALADERRYGGARLVFISRKMIFKPPHSDTVLGKAT